VHTFLATTVAKNCGGNLKVKLESLIPVIVGGLIGLAGGIVGPPLAHWLNEESSHRKKRAEKPEDMLGFIYAHTHWIDGLRSIRVFGEHDSREPSQLPKAQAIAAIYFPHFVDDLKAYDLTARKYEIWMLDAAKRRLAGDVSTLIDGGSEAYAPYYEKYLEILATLQKYAAKEFATH
jgi:hypothetical protein